MSVGHSEFSHDGLVPNPANGGQLSAADRLRAMRLTDPTNPNANEDDVYSDTAEHSYRDEDGVWHERTLRPGVTKPVTEKPGLPTTGRHGRVYPDRYNPGHEPDGYQDGSGQEWRDSVPPNPKF